MKTSNRLYINTSLKSEVHETILEIQFSNQRKDKISQIILFTHITHHLFRESNKTHIMMWAICLILSVKAGGIKVATAFMRVNNTSNVTHQRQPTTLIWIWFLTDAADHMRKFCHFVTVKYSRFSRQNSSSLNYINIWKQVCLLFWPWSETLHCVWVKWGDIFQSHNN